MTSAEIDAKVDEEVAERLRQADQRYTSGRRRLVSVLQRAEGPVTITQILAADRSLAQSSVYRNLAILEQVGVVTCIVTRDDFSRYELAEHLTEHHHHLICSSCGDVADFSLDNWAEASLDRALHQAAGRFGFAIDTHRLDLLGTCAACPN
ncbi:Fur family transcriptional regulator [Candidatus Poriferisocius sp.]|uniref:Fur family transcriptional regulator n=1 Tax=Candidatus Poriferisocius sp. TaxID=3101276 RepID=UPI003B5AA1B0